MVEHTPFSHQIASRDHPAFFRGTSKGSEAVSPTKTQSGKSSRTQDTSNSDERDKQQQQQQRDDDAAPTTATTKDDDDDDANNSNNNKVFVTMTADTARKVEKVVEKLVQGDLAQSTLLKKPRPLERTPAFSLQDDLLRGDLVGTGGFASIYSVDFRDPDVKRSFSSYHPKDDTQYVIKHLSPDVVKPLGKLCTAAFDIVLEAHFLAAMDHPNILKLEGCSKGGISSFSQTRQTDAFFMILPRLTCTLPDKMEQWQKQQPKKSSSSHSLHPSFMDLSMLICGFSSTQQLLLEQSATGGGPVFVERLQIVVDLLRALEYLHERRVMHRDIKQANIGFDQYGTLKLFDFGLAKEIPAGEDVYNDPKNAQPDDVWTPGQVGTLRYISPEIFLKDPIDCKTDVYSTSILCWELLTLHKAYEDSIQGPYFTQCVAIYGERPDIPKKWPRALKKLIEDGWTGRVAKRPSSTEMRVSLERIILLLQHSV